jgi:hypothetical protein
MSNRGAGLVIFILVLIIYLLTLSNEPAADGLIFAMDIESGEFGRLLDPTHLLLHPMGLGFYRLWQTLGWSPGAWRPSQALNALWGSLAVVVLYAIALRVKASRMTAVIVALGFAFSGGMWLLSVHAEYVTPALAVCLVILWVVIGIDLSEKNHKLESIFLAILTLIAVLFYANSVFLVPVVLAGYGLKEGVSKDRRLRHILVYLTTLFIVFLPLLVFVMRHAQTMEDYVLTLLISGSYGQMNPIDFIQGFYAFARSIALYEGLAMNDSTALFLTLATGAQRILFGFFYSFMGIIVLIPMFGIILHRRWIWQEHRRSLILLALWSGLYSLFAIYWVPGDISFWVHVLSAWWLILVIVMNAPPLYPTIDSVRTPLVAFFVMLLLINNALSVILPRHNLPLSPAMQTAQRINSLTSGEDIIVVNGLELIALEVEYFSNRRLIWLNPLPGSSETSINQIAKELAAGKNVYLIDACQLRCTAWQASMAEILPADASPIWETADIRVYKLKP